MTTNCNAPNWSWSVSYYIVPREKSALDPHDAGFHQNVLATYCV